MMKKITLALLLLIVPAAADSVRERLSATVRAQYGQRVPYALRHHRSLQESLFCQGLQRRF